MRPSLRDSKQARPCIMLQLRIEVQEEREHNKMNISDSTKKIVNRIAIGLLIAVVLFIVYSLVIK